MCKSLGKKVKTTIFIMIDNNFRYVSILLNLVAKAIGVNFTITGSENITKQVNLFVCNHFTRSETFFVPYLIFRKCNKKIRCLADHSLFHGALGRFLETLGTISTRNQNRDSIILKDLITGRNDWLIYPEGSMIKNKKIIASPDYLGNFISHTPHRIGAIHTGASVIALKSQLYREYICEAQGANKEELLSAMLKTFGIDKIENVQALNLLETNIVPITISYYPIRPGNNPISKFTAKIIKTLPQQIIEELEIEGNLLLNAEINIHFSPAINIAEYLNKSRNIVNQIPIIKSDTKTNMLIKYHKNQLTNHIMNKVYQNLQINLDHIFVALLFYFTDELLELKRLKQMIFLVSSKIGRTGKFRLNSEALSPNLIRMFNDEAFLPFEDLLNLAIKQQIISFESGGLIKINRNKLTQEDNFNQIRLNNTLQVIFNEFTLLNLPNLIAKTVAKTKLADLDNKVFNDIYHLDRKIFADDYQKYYNSQFSKSADIGKPFFLDARNGPNNHSLPSILLCHGYKSSPKEVEYLALFLHSKGYNVYGVRLAGHGTGPENIKDITWQDWYRSLQIGYAALANISNNIITIGFSTGGLLTLLNATQKKYHPKVIANVSINSALSLVDIRARMVAGINLWNEILTKIHCPIGKLEYVDDTPENPDINYSRNYLKGVLELENLMDVVKEKLHLVDIPTLVIQGSNDGVVNPKSGETIFNKIATTRKELYFPLRNNHVIITGQGKEEVFEKINDFLLNFSY
jgi:esterase/lipase